MLDANFIVLLAFILFMFIALKFGYKKSVAAVDHQIADIRAIITQATTDFETAQRYFLKEKEDQSKLSSKITELSTKTDEQIHLIKKDSVTHLQQLLESKQIIMDSMVDQTRFKIIQEVKDTLSNSIHQILSDLMKNHVDKHLHETLNDTAINQLDTLFLMPQNSHDEASAAQAQKK